MSSASDFSDTLFFDTHAGIKELTAAGVPEKQAEAQIKILSDLIKKDLVTKGYLDLKMKDLDLKLEVKIAQSESRIILKICGLLIAQSGIIVALIKLL